MHTYIHIYIVFTYMHTYIHTYIHAYMHYIRTYIHTYIHTCIHALHTYIHTYIHHIRTYIHTYIHTYVRTYMHTHIHIRNSWKRSLQVVFSRLSKNKGQSLAEQVPSFNWHAISEISEAIGVEFLNTTRSNPRDSHYHCQCSTSSGQTFPHPVPFLFSWRRLEQ